jgi:type III secretory pathway component EscS
MAKADSRDIVITLIREAITALKDQSLSPDEAEALLKGLAEALRAVIDIVPNWWGKAVLRVAAQIMEEAAAEIADGAS